MPFKENDYVKVIDQEIYGKVLFVHADTNEIVIEDFNSEYPEPDNQLIYRPSDLKKWKGVNHD